MAVEVFYGVCIICVCSSHSGLYLAIDFQKLKVFLLNLQDLEKGETRFTSKKPANEIITTIEEAAKPLGFNVQKRDYKMKLQGGMHGRKGHLSVATEV